MSNNYKPAAFASMIDGRANVYLAIVGAPPGSAPVGRMPLLAVSVNPRAGHFLRVSSN